MPFDPNIILAAGENVPVINPFQQYLSMRDMLDERRYKRAQLERLRLQTEQEQRQLADEQAFRAALPGLGQNATLADFARFGEPGLKYATQYRLGQQAEQTAKTAKLTQEKTERENALAIAKQQARELHAWTLLPKEQQADAYKRMQAGYRAKGLPADNDDTPPTPEELPHMYAAAGLTDDLLKEEKARKDAAYAEAEERRKAFDFAGKQQEQPFKLSEAQSKAHAERLKLLAPQLAQAMRSGLPVYNALVAELKDPEERKRFEGLMSEKDVLRVGESAHDTLAGFRADQPKDVDAWIALRDKPGQDPKLKEYADSVVKGMIAYHRAIQPPQQNVAGLTNTQFTQIQSRAREFDQHPIVKEFNTIASKFDAVKGIVDKPSLGGVGDIAVIYEWFHAVEPTSVVKKEEFDAAAKAGNIFAGPMARFNGYLKPEGGFLPPAVKQAFLETAQMKMRQQGAKVKKLYDDYGRRIDLITGQPGTGTVHLTNYAELYGAEPAATPGGGEVVVEWERGPDGKPRKKTGK